MSSKIERREFTICGHIGIAGKLEARDEKLMKRLFIQDYFRGPDSTGFATLLLTGQAKISKVSSHPIDLFQMKSFTDLLSAYKSSVFLGHNRYATKGLVNSYNAHPYEFDHIVGAHNGTLEKSSWDALHKNLGTEYPVDSMAIIAHLAKFGVEATVKLLQGAWSLVWIDTSTKTLNFLRNSERPMWLCYSEDVKKVFWASEHPMIRAALDMADTTHPYKVWKTKDKNYAYFSTDLDVLYTFDLVKLEKGEYKIDDLQPDARVRDDKGKIILYKGKEVPAKGYTMYTTTPKADPFLAKTTGQSTLTGASGTNSTQTSTTGSSSTTTSGSTTPSDSEKIVHLRGTEFNPLAGYISEKDFLEYAKYGCSWCQADVEYGDIGISVYPDTGSVRCAECSNNKTHNRIYVTPFEFANISR